MKAKNSMRNFIITFATNLIIILVSFISQKVFISMLGGEFLGLNGLFNNIISMLGIVELGIGNAIIYNLYKPIIKKDYSTINALMKFYRQSYHIITIIIFILGMFVIPFLPFFVTNYTLNINITLVYILFVIDVVGSYILSYNRSILYAEQKNYIVNLIHIVYYIMLNSIQIAILYLTKNYYLYLVIKIVFRLIENITITIYVNNKYKFLDMNSANNISKKTFNDVVKKVKALFFHKIGGFIVLGTDNIIISKYLGLVMVGIYSNYYLVIDAVNRLFGQAITSLIPSIGHLLVEENKTKNFEIFKKVRFINFWISTFTGVSLLMMMQSFIEIWLGKSYLLSIYVLIVLVINYYQKMMRSSFATFKEAAGIYHEDRFIPLVESIINIIVSIILVQKIGLVGVFIGTIISGMSLWCYSYPKYVYKKLFNRSYIDYAKETISYILLFLGILFVSYQISTLIHISNIYFNFIINILISLIIPNMIIIILFRNNDNLKYYYQLFKKMTKNM